MESSNTKRPAVTVKGKILHQTASAILIEVEGTGIWFPLSQVHEIHSHPTDVYESSIFVEHWIAEKRGLTR